MSGSQMTVWFCGKSVLKYVYHYDLDSEIIRLIKMKTSLKQQMYK